jgi:hypothetical protein
VHDSRKKTNFHDTTENLTSISTDHYRGDPST